MGPFNLHFTLNPQNFQHCGFTKNLDETSLVKKVQGSQEILHDEPTSGPFMDCLNGRHVCERSMKDDIGIF